MCHLCRGLSVCLPPQDMLEHVLGQQPDHEQARLILDKLVERRRAEDNELVPPGGDEPDPAASAATGLGS